MTSRRRSGVLRQHAQSLAVYRQYPAALGFYLKKKKITRVLAEKGRRRTRVLGPFPGQRVGLAFAPATSSWGRPGGRFESQRCQFYDRVVVPLFLVSVPSSVKWVAPLDHVLGQDALKGQDSIELLKESLCPNEEAINGRD